MAGIVPTDKIIIIDESTSKTDFKLEKQFMRKEQKMKKKYLHFHSNKIF